MARIIFVDEERTKIKVFGNELRYSGHEYNIIENADDALEEILRAKEGSFDLVVIDIMLAARVNSSEFPAKDTDDYKKTGLMLLGKLKKSSPAVFPRKACFLTCATSESLIKEIENAASENVPMTRVLRKGDYQITGKFTRDIEEILREIARG